MKTSVGKNGTEVIGSLPGIDIMELKNTIARGEARQYGVQASAEGLKQQDGWV